MQGCLRMLIQKWPVLSRASPINATQTRQGPLSPSLFPGNSCELEPGVERCCHSTFFNKATSAIDDDFYFCLLICCCTYPSRPLKPIKWMVHHHRNYFSVPQKFGLAATIIRKRLSGQTSPDRARHGNTALELLQFVSVGPLAHFHINAAHDHVIQHYGEGFS